MNLNWRKAHSSVLPATVDDTSSKKSVYIRRNVEAVEEPIDDEGNTVTFYNYEEAKISREEYAKYLTEQQSE